MESNVNKNSMGWGVLLITLGVTAYLETFLSLSDWYAVAVLGAGFLVSLALFLGTGANFRLAIPTYILFALTAISAMAIAEILEGEFIGSLVLGLVGLPFFFVFFYNRANNWWALIPGYILFSIALMVFLIGINVLNDAWVALFVLTSIGIPFLVVYLLNRTNWWALIPAYVMFSIGIMVSLIDNRLLNDLAIPAYVMFAIAIPFLFVYFTNRSQWWALIPGGIMTVIGLGFWAGTDLAQYVIPAVLILAGLMVLYRSIKK